MTLSDVVLRLLPPELRAGEGVKRWLMVPLLLEQQLAGALVIGQDNVDADFTPWEIELVNVVATHTMLLLNCIRCWGQAQAEGRTLAQQEIERLVDDFLNLASHEFNTSLTTIKGNVQVAQRRWAALKRQLAVQGASVSEKMECVEDTLEATVKSVRLQERILRISSMIHASRPTNWRCPCTATIYARCCGRRWKARNARRLGTPSCWKTCHRQPGCRSSPMPGVSGGSSPPTWSRPCAARPRISP